LAYLTWTGFEIDYDNLPSVKVSYLHDDTTLAAKGSEIIAGIMYGALKENSYEVVDEQCFPELGSWVQEIEDSWLMMNTYIDGDVEDGFVRLVQAIKQLPMKAHGCTGYAELMTKLDATMLAYGAWSETFADEVHAWMVEHGRDDDISFMEAMHGYVKPEWTYFGMALGNMLQ